MSRIPRTIVMSQISPLIGDIQGNIGRIKSMRQCYPAADLIVFSECFLTCYPMRRVYKPRTILDKLFPDRQRQSFIKEAHRAVLSLAKDMKADGQGPAVLIGAPQPGPAGEPFNAMHLIENDGDIQTVLKHNLDTQDLYDEFQHFQAGPPPRPVEFRGFDLGVAIGNDAQSLSTASAMALEGMDILIIPTASPYARGKQQMRVMEGMGLNRQFSVPILFVNQVSGDMIDVVYEGGSYAINRNGHVLFQAGIAEISQAITISAQQVYADIALDTSPVTDVSIENLATNVCEVLYPEDERQVSHLMGRLWRAGDDLIALTD